MLAYAVSDLTPSNAEWDASEIPAYGVSKFPPSHPAQIWRSHRYTRGDIALAGGAAAFVFVDVEVQAAGNFAALLPDADGFHIAISTARTFSFSRTGSDEVASW